MKKLEPFEAKVIHVDFADNLLNLSIPLRERMYQFKATFWQMKGINASAGGTGDVSIKKVGENTGVTPATVYKWKTKYDWFESWLHTPNTAQKTKVQVMWDAAYVSMCRASPLFPMQAHDPNIRPPQGRNT